MTYWLPSVTYASKRQAGSSIGSLTLTKKPFLWVGSTANVRNFTSRPSMISWALAWVSFLLVVVRHRVEVN